MYNLEPRVNKNTLYTFLSLDPSSKPDLGDVIIAAAAAKMVKLDPAVPAPTSQEFGAQYCR